MRLIDNDTTLIDAVLSGFLRSFADPFESDYKSDFWASSSPLLGPDGEIIRALSSSPSEELKKAWLNHLEGSAFYRFSPVDPENHITITPALTALAIVTYNFLKTNANPNQNKEEESVFDYNLKLCQTIPQVINPVDGIIYDILIEPCCRLWRKISTKTSPENLFLAALVRINPFSELKNLDLFLPAPLKVLTGSYLAHQHESNESFDLSNADAGASLGYQQWWIQAEKFILNSSSKRVLRDQWLSIPENSLSCMGLGIFFEELRRRGEKQFSTPILEFFEAYDYMQRHQTQTQDGPSSPYHRLTVIRHLLESKNIELNRKGNEYFLKFRALLEIIAKEQSIPRKFRHLSLEFCLQNLAPLATLATIIGGERKAMAPTFEAIQFSDQP